MATNPKGANTRTIQINVDEEEYAVWKQLAKSYGGIAAAARFMATKGLELHDPEAARLIMAIRDKRRETVSEIRRKMRLARGHKSPISYVGVPISKAVIVIEDQHNPKIAGASSDAIAAGSDTSASEELDAASASVPKPTLSSGADAPSAHKAAPGPGDRPPSKKPSSVPKKAPK